jgi:hypothetical protein
MNESLAREPNTNMDSASRKLAHRSLVVIVISTALGSLLPEPADVVALWLKIYPHTFNYLFLAIGVIGVGVALLIGYRNGSVRT